MAGNGRVALVFDDGVDADFREVRPVLEARDAPASFAVVSGWIGDDGRLDLDELRVLAAGGCEILAHGRRHRVLRPHRLAADAEVGGRRLRIESHVFPNDDAGVVVGDEYELADDEEHSTVEVVGKGRDGGTPHVEVDRPLERPWSASETVLRLPESGLADEISGARADFRALGFDPAGFVFPYDAADVRAHRIARETYDAIPNAAVRSLPNPPGTPAWDLRRYYLETDALTRVEIADYLDEVAETGGLGLLAGHAAWDTVPPERVAFAVDAARERGIEVTTVSDAMAGGGGCV